MSSDFLVDTNIVIHHLNENFLFHRQVDLEKIHISTISIMELFALAGMSKSEEEKIRPTIGYLKKVPVTENIAERAGYLARTRPNRNNRSDLLIAATAIELEIPLVTKNIRDFKAIPEIQLMAI